MRIEKEYNFCRVLRTRQTKSAQYISIYVTILGRCHYIGPMPTLGRCLLFIGKESSYILKINIYIIKYKILLEFQILFIRSLSVFQYCWTICQRIWLHQHWQFLKNSRLCFQIFILQGYDAIYV